MEREGDEWTVWRGKVMSGQCGGKVMRGPVWRGKVMRDSVEGR